MKLCTNVTRVSLYQPLILVTFWVDELLISNNFTPTPSQSDRVKTPPGNRRGTAKGREVGEDMSTARSETRKRGGTVWVEIFVFFEQSGALKKKIRIHGSGLNTSTIYIYTNESKSKFSDTVPIFFWEKRLLSLLWSLYIGRCIAQEFLHNRTPSLKAMAVLWCENTGYPPTTWQHGRPILTCLDAWRVALSSMSCGKGHGPATRRFGALA